MNLFIFVFASFQVGFYECPYWVILKSFVSWAVRDYSRSLRLTHAVSPLVLLCLCSQTSPVQWMLALIRCLSCSCTVRLIHFIRSVVFPLRISLSGLMNPTQTTCSRRLPASLLNSVHFWSFCSCARTIPVCYLSACYFCDRASSGWSPDCHSPRASAAVFSASSQLNRLCQAFNFASTAHLVP